MAPKELKRRKTKQPTIQPKVQFQFRVVPLLNWLLVLITCKPN